MQELVKQGSGIGDQAGTRLAQRQSGHTEPEVRESWQEVLEEERRLRINGQAHLITLRGSASCGTRGACVETWASAWTARQGQATGTPASARRNGTADP